MKEPPGRTTFSTEEHSANVSVHIERLVIDGLPLTAREGVQLQRALQRELAHLITGRQQPGHWRATAVPSLVAPSLNVPAAVRPSQLGREIARSIFASLHQSA